MQGIFNLSSTSSGGGSGFAPKDVTNLKVKAGDSKLTLTWNDPDDFVVESVTLSKWKGTKVVYKIGSYPLSPTDGVVAANSEIRNQYAENGLEITGLINDTTYYFQLFPYSDNDVYNEDETNRISGIPKPYKIYGIKRSLTTSSPAWERTDDAVGLIANAQIGTDPVQNDFDSLYPWSDIYTYSYSKGTNEETRFDEPGFSYKSSFVFTKIPEFWYKRWQDSTHEYIQIATSEVNGFTKCDTFSVGRYLTSKLAGTFEHSQSGETPATNQTLDVFRTDANKTPGWGILDWRYFILQILYLVEYADYDSQTKLGMGWSSGNSVVLNNGSCDFLGMKSGRPAGTDGKTGVIYRGIENIFGNIYQWVDGIRISSHTASICMDPTKYASGSLSSGDYVELSYGNSSSDGYISKLGYDSNYPLVAFPIASSGSETTYVCDYSYAGGNYSYNAISVGGYWTQYYNNANGLFTWYLGNSGAKSYIGSRLLKYQ